MLDHGIELRLTTATENQSADWSCDVINLDFGEFTAFCSPRWRFWTCSPKSLLELWFGRGAPGNGRYMGRALPPPSFAHNWQLSDVVRSDRWVMNWQPAGLILGSSGLSARGVDCLHQRRHPNLRSGSTKGGRPYHLRRRIDPRKRGARADATAKAEGASGHQFHELHNLLRQQQLVVARA